MEDLPPAPSFKSGDQPALWGRQEPLLILKNEALPLNIHYGFFEKQVLWLRHQTAGDGHQLQILAGGQGTAGSWLSIMSIFSISYHLWFAIQLFVFCMPYLKTPNGARAHKAWRHWSQSAWLCKVWGCSWGIETEQPKPPEIYKSVFNIFALKTPLNFHSSKRSSN